MKASCAAVILGMEDRIVLANAEGVDSDDDFWLKDFCAWALAQDSGLVTIEDLSQDERWAALLHSNPLAFSVIYVRQQEIAVVDVNQHVHQM